MEIKKVTSEEFEELVQKKMDEEYDRLYKEKFTEAYMITYSMSGGDDDHANKVAEDEAYSYAEHMMDVIEDEVREDLGELYEVV